MGGQTGDQEEKGIHNVLGGGGGTIPWLVGWLIVTTPSI